MIQYCRLFVWRATGRTGHAKKNKRKEGKKKREKEKKRERKLPVINREFSTFTCSIGRYDFIHRKYRNENSTTKRFEFHLSPCRVLLRAIRDARRRQVRVATVIFESIEIIRRAEIRRETKIRLIPSNSLKRFPIDNLIILNMIINHFFFRII